MFTDRELKYLKNILNILNMAKFDVKGDEILPIATSMTMLQTSIIPKMEKMVEQSEVNQELMSAKSPVKKEPSKKSSKTKTGK